MYYTITLDRSPKQYITCAILQGSVLGPLLFLMYINDIPHCLKHSKSIVFADDTTIFASCNNMNTLYGPFLLKLLVTLKIMYKNLFFKCAINVVKAVQVNISNAYMKLQSMN